MRRAISTTHGTHCRPGNALVLVTLSLVVLVGVAGLAIDGGLLMHHRRQAQYAADAAAVAAAIDLSKGATATSARQTALTYAGYNGYSNDGSSNTVTVNIPPGSGPNAGNADYVEVIPVRNLTTSFVRVVYPGSATARARGVAGLERAPASPAGLIVSQPNDSSVKVSGNADVKTNGGGSILVNSNHEKAVDASGNAKLTATNINITGDYELSGNAQLVGSVQTGVATTPDPIKDLPGVNPLGLPVQSVGDLSYSGNGSYTLQPGLYTGKIDLSGQVAVTMQPGIYYVTGEFKLSGQSSLTANGVMIYAAQKVTMSGQGNVVITPPDSGTYAGISIFQDRNALSNDITLSGNGNMEVSGTIYAWNAKVTISGNGTTDSYGSQFICRSLTVSGNGTINLDYDPNRVAKSSKVYLVE